MVSHFLNFHFFGKIYGFRIHFYFYDDDLNSKTMAKMAVARIKLLRNKRQVVVRQMRRDIAMLLESKQDATARVRVMFL